MRVYGRCVAQLGSALSWGVRGRRFKSYHTDHYLLPYLSQSNDLNVYLPTTRARSGLVGSPKRQERFGTRFARPTGCVE